MLARKVDCQHNSRSDFSSALPGKLKDRLSIARSRETLGLAVESLSRLLAARPVATRGSISGTNSLDEGSRLSIYLRVAGFEYVIDLTLFLPVRQMTSMIKEEDLMTDESY